MKTNLLRRNTLKKRRPPDKNARSITTPPSHRRVHAEEAVETPRGEGKDRVDVGGVRRDQVMRLLHQKAVRA